MSNTPCNLDRSVRLLQDVYPNEPVKEVLNRHQELLSKAICIARKNQRSHSITDKPFEIFWDNPSEINHSRLLAYFLNPQESHGFGKEILRLFYNTCQQSNLSVDDDTKLYCEAYAPTQESRGFIDVMIYGGKHSSEYAVVIENKVNDAPDQQSQLNRYYRRMFEDGISDENIHIIYLPLRHRRPHPSIVNSIPKSCLHLCSFDKEVRNWLKSCIDIFAQSADPVRQGFKQNLEHYRNLLNYRIESDREYHMQTQILERLSNYEHELCKDIQHQYKDLNTLVTAIQSIQACLQAVLRGKLILGVCQNLKDNRLDFSYYDASGRKVDEQFVNHGMSPFNPGFLNEYKVGIKLNDNCVLCIAVSPDDKDRPCWFGIMRDSDFIQTNNRYYDLLKDYNPQSNDYWLAYWYVDNINYDNCDEPETHRDMFTQFHNVYNMLRVVK